MHNLIQQLVARKPVTVDGAWGTQLQLRGLAVGSCPEAWNLEQFSRVEDVAGAYMEAGARIILTNSFGGNRVALQRHGLAERTLEINVAAAQASVNAAAGRAKVFGSMGPTGTALEKGERSREEVAAVFAEQAKALQEGGVDGLVVETMFNLEEASAAVSAAKQTGLPVVACMVFPLDEGSDHNRMNVTPEEAAATLEAAGADVIGTNCMGMATSLRICKRFRGCTALPVWIKANAGLPEMVNGLAVYAVTPEAFAEHAAELVEAGADFVGGCCGTSPDMIAAVAETLSRMR